MNITIICEVLGEANNGTSIAGYNLINYLRSRGHKVNVVCPDQDKKGQEGYYVLPLDRLISAMCKKNGVVIAKFDKETIYQAVKDADIVHIMMPLFLSRSESKYVKSLGKPLTGAFHAQAQNFTSHFGMLHSKCFNSLIYKWYNSNLYCRVQAIHYPSQYIRDEFEREIGHKTNGYVISNGVNKMFRPDPQPKPESLRDKYCILYTGRLAHEKSHIVLLKAVEQSKYKDKIQLIFAGDGPRRESLKAYASKHLPNQPIIDFFPRQELLKIINYCDLYCHPAEAETEAIACLEAIACGLVPLIANSPECATKGFALDDRCLFKVNDSSDLASKIDWFIEHPDEKAALKEKYISESTLYDQDQCMKQMEEMFLTEIERAKNGKA